MFYAFVWTATTDGRPVTPAAPFLTIEMQKDDIYLNFFSTLTTLGTPYDITLHELRIENYFPADEATDVTLRKLSVAGAI